MYKEKLYHSFIVKITYINIPCHTKNCIFTELIIYLVRLCLQIIILKKGINDEIILGIFKCFNLKISQVL